MQSYDKDNVGKIKKSAVSIAKNYLNEEEIKLLGLLRACPKTGSWLVGQ